MATVDPEGGRERIEYDRAARPVRRINAAGEATDTVYDDAGRAPELAQAFLAALA